MSTIRYLVLIAFIHVVIGSSYGQRLEIDSLQRLLARTQGKEKIQIYQQIITRLWLNHPDSAMLYARQAVKLANQLGDPRSKSIAIRLLGGVHYYLGRYDSTIQCSVAALNFSLQAGDSTLISSSLNNLGLAYYNVGSYPEAMEYLLRALNMKIRLNQIYGLAQTHNNVGLLFTELKNYTKAREYYRNALAIATKEGDKSQRLYSYNNIGFTFLEENKIDSADRYFSEALEMAKTTDNAYWHSVSFSGLAQVRMKQERVEEARQLLNQSMKLRQRIEDLSGISEIYHLYGSIFVKKNRYDSAFYSLHKSLAIARQIDDKDNIIANLEQLKELYQKTNRLDSALFYFTQYVAARDQVMNENLVRNIGAVQLKIEREAANAQLAAKDVRIEQITQQTYFLIGAVFLTVLISFFTFRLYKNQIRLTRDIARKNSKVLEQTEEIKRQNDALALSHAELEAAQELIKQKNRALEDVNQHLESTVAMRTEQLEIANQQLRHVNLELDNFVYRSSHDIRGPLVRLIGICHVALLDVNDRVAREYFEMLSDTAAQLNEIFDRLKVVSQINDTEPARELVDVQEVLHSIKERLGAVEGYQKIEILEEIEAGIFQTDSFLFGLILENLLENAVRFQKPMSEEPKFVRIRVQRNQGRIRLAVADNGIGINEETLEHIYQMFSKAARNHNNIGMGLYIVKQSVQKLGGTISLVNNPDHWTEFEVVLPEMVSENRLVPIS